MPKPTSARTFSESRRIRLSEMDAEGRLRLDSIARYLQDVAVDDVDETGWGAPEHLWVLRSIRMGGSDAVARRPRGGAHHVVQRVGDGGGRQEDVAGRRPRRKGGARQRLDPPRAGRRAGPDRGLRRLCGIGRRSDRLDATRAAAPPSDARRRPWETRASDIDLFGHVNNAVYWQGVEGRLRDRGIDPRAPLVARLDYRHAVDLGEVVELAEFSEGGGCGVAFVSGDVLKAVALVQRM